MSEQINDAKRIARALQDADNQEILVKLLNYVDKSTLERDIESLIAVLSQMD